jgi:hypothetical protein
LAKQKIFDYLNKNLVLGEDGCWYSHSTDEPTTDLMNVTSVIVANSIVLCHLNKFLYNDLIKQTYEDILETYAQEIKNAKNSIIISS